MENGRFFTFLLLIETSPPKRFVFRLENAEGSASDTSKLQEQFNTQRAKMKELYLSKEKECVHLKQKMILLKKEIDDKDSQLVIAEYTRQKDLEDQKEVSQQEIQTLQTLLQETCDEATLANNEISRLSEENERSRVELMSLKEVVMQQQQQQVGLLTPFTTFKLTFFFCFNSRNPTRV